jgi:hypothetical protein
MIKALLIFQLASLYLLLGKTAQAQITGIFTVTEKWTVTIDYADFGAKNLTGSRSFSGTASGTVRVVNGQYELQNKGVSATLWSQVLPVQRARTITKVGSDYSVNGGIVFAEGVVPPLTLSGVGLLGFFAVPISVEQGETIAAGLSPIHFKAVGPEGAIQGGGTFPQQDAYVRVTSTISLTPKPLETALPGAKITSPLNNSSVITPTVNISGTATDNVGVAEVKVTVENSAGAKQYTATLSGTTWALADVPLFAGENKLKIRARDFSENLSTEVISTVFYDVVDEFTFFTMWWTNLH